MIKFGKSGVLGIALCSALFTVNANAALIDFTDSTWGSAIVGNTATIGNVTLTGTGGLTFNGGGDSAGCAGAGSILACDGDGIGIGDDEITQGGNETITVSFASPVNITGIYLLDLFANEGNGETAVIDGAGYLATTSNSGGLFMLSLLKNNASSIVFTGNNDRYSDYALAGLEVSAVPLPGAFILFGSALMGFFGIKRRSKVKA